MILVGNVRAGGQDLARHLMSPDNERVTLHSINGFASDDLKPIAVVQNVRNICIR